MSSLEDIAWAAGLFEGEGFFSQTMGPPRKDGSRSCYPEVGLVSADEDVLRRFHAIIGIGTVYHRKPETQRHKETWGWQVSSISRVSFVYALLKPYLGERRLARGQEVMDNYWATCSQRARENRRSTTVYA